MRTTTATSGISGSGNPMQDPTVSATVNDDQSIDEESYGNNDLTRTITVEDQETGSAT